MNRLLAFIAALLALATAAPAAAEWRRAESPNFVLYGEQSEAQLRERILLLEDFDRLLRSFTSVTAEPAPNKLHVFVVRGAGDLRVIRPFDSSVGGFYTAGPYGIAAVVDEGAGSDNELLFHEYAHHFMMQYAAGAYPQWYVEGFAEYFSSAHLSERTITIGRVPEHRGHWLVMETWLPIERVLFGTLAGLTPEQGAQFYAQSWLVAHYFFSTPERQAALRRYLVADQEAGSAEAFEAATGMSPRALVQQLRRYIGRGRINYTSYPRGSTEAPPPVTVTALPRSANDLMLYQAALRIGLYEGRGESTLQRIREIAARHGQDALARRVLAHAEALYGDAAAADRLLDQLLVEFPDDAELMYLKGMRHLRAAEKAEAPESDLRAARRWFTRAHNANGNHFQTLYRFAQSMQTDPNYVSENMANVLLLAHQLAPQVPDIRIAAAEMLMNRDQFEPAAILLRPLAADPHNSALAQRAKTLLDRARARQRPLAETGDAAESDEAAEAQD